MSDVIGHCKTCGVPMTATTPGVIYPDRTIECEPCWYGPSAEGVSVVTSPT